MVLQSILNALLLLNECKTKTDISVFYFTFLLKLFKTHCESHNVGRRTASSLRISWCSPCHKPLFWNGKSNDQCEAVNVQTFEAVTLLLVFDSVEHVADVTDTAAAKLAVVGAISTRSRCKHYEVTTESSRPALGWVIMLQTKCHHSTFQPTVISH